MSTILFQDKGSGPKRKTKNCLRASPQSLIESPLEYHVLRRAVDEIGHYWEKVSAHVGRFATDCRDRYRNHLSERNTRNTGTPSSKVLLFSWCSSADIVACVAGAWTEAEEQELIAIVREVQEDQGKDYDDNDDILWSTVSARMGGRRGKQQVRDKWLVLQLGHSSRLLMAQRRLNQLRSRVQNDTEKLTWTNKDSVILLRRYGPSFHSTFTNPADPRRHYRLASLELEDESEINWNALSDGDWNLWSAHTLQRHWAKMKKRVKGHEDRTFGGMILRLCPVLMSSRSPP